MGSAGFASRVLSWVCFGSVRSGPSRRALSTPLAHWAALDSLEDDSVGPVGRGGSGWNMGWLGSETLSLTVPSATMHVGPRVPSSRTESAGRFCNGRGGLC